MDTILQLKVKPRAKTSSLQQMPDGTWLARLKSPPVDGKANKELIALIAAHFRCGKADVHIKTGANARTKIIQVKAREEAGAVRNKTSG
jgi:uncharacterized protein